MASDRWPNAGRKTSIKPTHIVKSPAFTTSYPKIINGELIDPFVRGLMEVSWTKGLFEERNIEVFILKGGYVVDETLVLDEHLQVVDNVCDDYSPEEIEKALGIIFEKSADSTLPWVGDTAILAKRRAAGNYGHYLMYMLPLASIAKRLFGERNPVYLSHRVLAPMQDVVLRSFRLLGISLDRVLIRAFGEPVHYDELVFFSGLDAHGGYLSPLAVQALVDMAAPIPAGPHRKIFVRRIPGWQRGRLMHNEEEIANRLAAKGFHVIEPGSMSLEEQISTFKGAEHVVGSVGAGMTNIAFCQPGANVTVLSSGVFPDTFFWFVANHRRLNYVDMRGDRVTFDDSEAWQAGFSIREVDIQRLEMLGQTLAKPDVVTTGVDPLIEGTSVLAHACYIGDIQGRLNDWIGTKGSQNWIEGFAITLPDGTPPTDIQYAAVLGDRSMSTLHVGGSYCGTRGLGAPIHGFCIWLHGDLAHHYDCHYSAAFMDGTNLDFVPAGQVCTASALAPLVAFKIILRRRHAS
jgi:hypothetical protein